MVTKQKRALKNNADVFFRIGHEKSIPSVRFQQIQQTCCFYSKGGHHESERTNVAVQRKQK